jgi:ACR3 family arsenite transporter
MVRFNVFTGDILLKDYPEYMTGLIIIGIAPCAMVIVWNELAEGNRELTAGLIGINSLLQVFFFSLYAFLFGNHVAIIWNKRIRIEYNRCSNRNNSWYLFRIPFCIAVISRYAIKKFIGDKWFNQNLFLLFPITLIALLLIVVMFSLREMIVDLPLDVIRIAIPLVIFFTIMFFSDVLFKKSE